MLGKQIARHALARSSSFFCLFLSVWFYLRSSILAHLLHGYIVSGCELFFHIVSWSFWTSMRVFCRALLFFSFPFFLIVSWVSLPISIFVLSSICCNSSFISKPFSISIVILSFFPYLAPVEFYFCHVRYLFFFLIYTFR